MILVHRCRKCGHINLEHGATSCQDGFCSCGNDRADFGPTETLTTYDTSPRHAIVETVTQPGGVWNRRRMCSCQDCARTYAEIVA